MGKKKIGKHLQFYMDCIKDKALPGLSLCFCTEDENLPLDNSLLELFTPTRENEKELFKNGFSMGYWASGSTSNQYYKFTELRQTIVLFMACLNGEL